MKIPGAHFVWAQLGIYSISGTGPIFQKEHHDFLFNNGSKRIPLQNKKVVKSVSTPLNVFIGGKYACLE